MLARDGVSDKHNFPEDASLLSLPAQIEAADESIVVTSVSAGYSTEQ